MGSALGATKTAAARIGLPMETYLSMLAAGLKWCRACHGWHPRSSFGVDRSRTDGLASSCAESRVVAVGRPGAAVRKAQAGLGLGWCRGCEVWIPLSELRKGACRSHRNDELRAAYAKNPGPTRARVYARKRDLAVIPHWWRTDRFEEFGGLCAYGCQSRASALDHVWPVVLGGESRADNLVPACQNCNSRKRDGDPYPWIDRFASAFPDEYIDFIALNYVRAGHIDILPEVA